MVKATMDIRLKTVILYSEGVRTAKEISQLYNISGRTLRRWCKEYLSNGIDGLRPEKTGPKRGNNKTSQSLIQRIISLKRKYPAWGARRIKYQFDIPLH